MNNSNWSMDTTRKYVNKIAYIPKESGSLPVNIGCLKVLRPEKQSKRKSAAEIHLPENAY